MSIISQEYRFVQKSSIPGHGRGNKAKSVGMQQQKCEKAHNCPAESHICTIAYLDVNNTINEQRSGHKERNMVGVKTKVSRKTAEHGRTSSEAHVRHHMRDPQLSGKHTMEECTEQMTAEQ